MNNLGRIKRDLRLNVKKEKAEFLPRFFKTGPGEYGEGDIFLGVMTPDIDKISKKYKTLKMVDVGKLLRSKIHEERVCALQILLEKWKKAEEKEREKIFDFYINKRKHINNWDLVDMSAPKIVGDYLFYKSKDTLYKFAQSENLWEKRIAIISTLYFIRNNFFEDTIKISKMLLTDGHDLIHKAVGWMLREVGKRNQKIEEDFLKKHHKEMPRTMLRYAIEKFPENKRKLYLVK